MPALADLKDDMRDLALKAHAVVEDDKLTGAEKRDQLDKFDVDIKALADQIADLTYLDGQRAKYAGLMGDEPAGDPVAAADSQQPAPARLKSFGEQLVETEAFKAVNAQVKKFPGTRIESGPVELKGGFDTLTLKATLLESGLTSGNVIAQDRQPGILPILFERLQVADLMPNGATNSNTVRYAKESTATNAAATVAEGAAKPESTLNFTVVDEPVRKIATTIKVSDEMLEDVAQIQSYINGRLVLFVRLQEEAQLLTGDGTGTNLVGILNRSGLTAAQAKGADSIAVAVHKEITKIRVASFLDPDGLVFHPNDWEAAALESDANGQFFGGGPFTGAYGQGGAPGAGAARTYWGLRPVITQSETENTVLIGAFATAAQVFRRTGITVDMTNSNEDDFKKNLVAVRAEERLALAMYRPAAFGTVTGV